jgi:hypothetical protein
MLPLGVFRDPGEALVALAVACVVPLGVSVACRAMGDEGREARALQRLLAVAAPFGLASFVPAVGALAGVLAGVWMLATLAVALRGWQRLAVRGAAPLALLAVDLGHLYLPVGGAWLLASRAGVSPMGFFEPIVLYTAAHFHYAGFAAPVVLGLLGLSLFPDGVAARGALAVWYGVAAVVVMAGVPLVAVGITVSRALESPSAVVLGAGMLVGAWLLLREGLRRLRSETGWARVSGALLGVAGLSLVLSMGFAVAFAMTGSAGRAAPGGRISFHLMAAVHGAANALGFALCGLLAFALRGPPAAHGVVRFTRPRLSARGFVGVDFFDRVGAVDSSRPVRGQLDDLDDFAREGFDPARVDPRVRAFYERTAVHALRAEAVWHAPFRAPAALFRRAARRLLGQLELPLRDEHGETVALRARRRAGRPGRGAGVCAGVRRGGEHPGELRRRLRRAARPRRDVPLLRVPAALRFIAGAAALRAGRAGGRALAHERVQGRRRGDVPGDTAGRAAAAAARAHRRVGRRRVSARRAPRVDPGPALRDALLRAHARRGLTFVGAPLVGARKGP